MLSDIYHVYFNYVRCVSLIAIKSFKFFVIIVERTQDLTQPSCSPPSGLQNVSVDVLDFYERI